MNLIVPVNLQVLRVSPNDASLITKSSDHFSGPTTSFDGLPWRDANYVEYDGRASRANLSANVVNPVAGQVEEQLEAGVHLHWALPDALARGTQGDVGTITFPAAPNRWLITRILRRAGACVTRQWVLESDRLVTEVAYRAAYGAGRFKAISVPVGWALLRGSDPTVTGGALYYPPSRRMGQVFDLAVWRPQATPPGAAPDQVLHLDEIVRGAAPFAQAGSPEPLKAVDSTGVAFAAYYPDCRSVFGFHDRFADLGDGFDLGDAAFDVSYQVIGWHSRQGDDPLAGGALAEDLSRTAAEGAGAAATAFGWLCAEDGPAPERCLYSGQAVGLGWDATGDIPGSDPAFPKCYLTPPADDPTARLALGSSASAAMAALVCHEWQAWTGRSPTGDSPTPPPDARVGQDLEFLLDALQLGLLHKVGSGQSLPELEQALHRSGFGSQPGGRLWTVRAQPSGSDKSDPDRFRAPDPTPPVDDSDLGGKLDRLNAAQARLNALQGVIESCRRQIYLDWTHYIGAVGASPPAGGTLIDDLKTYISGQILDLWTKLEAAYGVRSPAGPATANVPLFFADAVTCLALADGRYASPSPPRSLAGQIAAAANAVLDVLARPGYAAFALERTDEPRFWEPHDVVAVATADSLRPAQRNGTAKLLPCRTSARLVSRLEAVNGDARAELTAAEAAGALGLAAPTVAGGAEAEGRDAEALLGDIAALLGEAVLLDPVAASVWSGRLAGLGAGAADLAAALGDALRQIDEAWRAGAPDTPGAVPAPRILADLGAQAGALRVTLHGQAPQGVGVTLAPAVGAPDVFLPLFLVWEARYQPFEKGAVAAADRYDPDFLDRHFALDADAVDLTPGSDAPRPTAGTVALSGAIPLSSRAAEPLLDQIRQYLAEAPDEHPELQAVIAHLQGKPLLSQSLSGINPALIARSAGLQMVPFDPFYDAEPPAALLSRDPSTLVYANVLTHFVAQAAGASDQAPLATGTFTPLRAGRLAVATVAVVDVFGRKRRIIDTGAAAQADRIVVSAALTPAGSAQAGAAAQLPPRFVQPARLDFDWMSAADAQQVSNGHPSTSPVCGWVVSNLLDGSLMLFSPSGAAAGALGAFGARTEVAWQSPPGRPARTLEQDLAAPELAPLAKFARAIQGKPRATFDALMAAIEGAHTYIVPDASASEQPYAVLMGRPMALVRAGLRLELSGLPAFATDLATLQAATGTAAPQAYDWTRRQAAGLLDVEVSVRLGDRNHLSDGLVAYLLEGSDTYDRIYAPGAPEPDGDFVVRPAADTLRVTPHARLDPPGSPFPDRAAQGAALTAATERAARTPVTLLIDPRAGVHAATGLLPVKSLELPGDICARALGAIEAFFFTHPVLRGAQGLSLPTPDEAGFTWRWTTAVKRGGEAEPRDEDLIPYRISDRAHFTFSPQVAQDGWLRLVPKPASDTPEPSTPTA